MNLKEKFLRVARYIEENGHRYEAPKTAEDFIVEEFRAVLPPGFEDDGLDGMFTDVPAQIQKVTDEDGQLIHLALSIYPHTADCIIAQWSHKDSDEVKLAEASIDGRDAITWLNRMEEHIQPEFVN